MSEDALSFESFGKKYLSGKTRAHHIDMHLRFDGLNKDIVETYYWHLNFPYLTARGYFAIKLEDHHYFSENSQFGSQMRQIKGGTIKAFQENLQQLVQLVKVHLIPLLKEVKQAEFYKKWFDDITINDKELREEMKKKEPDPKKIKDFRSRRNEAINHIKDKWVSEVDGGKIWQLQKSATEQGLDFALLPQLFFGVNLDNPLYDVHKEGQNLQEQIEQDIHSLDITKLAREQIARFHYKFHVWLPTAIKETEVTYKLKISALKQFYAQIQMYVNFMKPLLIEISKKNESLNKSNSYRGFEYDNPEFVSLFDYSYSYIKLLQIKLFEKENYAIEDLEFTKYGFLLSKYKKNGKERNKDGKHPLAYGPYKGKDGYIIGTNESGDEYEYVLLGDNEHKKMNAEIYKKLREENTVKIKRDHLKSFVALEFDFSQKRRSEMVKTEQGPQQLPYMINEVFYKGYVWNLYEIASHREKSKVENLEILETFIEEIKVIKEDLLHYVNDLEGSKSLIDTETKEEEEKEEKKKEGEWDFVFGPVKGIASVFSPLLPQFSFGGGSSSPSSNDAAEMNDQHLIVRLRVAEELWKVYLVHKKTHGFVSY